MSHRTGKVAQHQRHRAPLLLSVEGTQWDQVRATAKDKACDHSSLPEPLGVVGPEAVSKADSYLYSI